MILNFFINYNPHLVTIINGQKLKIPWSIPSLWPWPSPTWCWGQRIMKVGILFSFLRKRKWKRNENKTTEKWKTKIWQKVFLLSTSVNIYDTQFCAGAILPLWNEKKNFFYLCHEEEETIFFSFTSLDERFLVEEEKRFPPKRRRRTVFFSLFMNSQ